MPTNILTPGANAALTSGDQFTLTMSTDRGRADLIVLCLGADGRADGDNGVALWTQPHCANGAVRIEVPRASVTARLSALPAEVQRLLIVAQADGAADLSGVAALSAQIDVDGVPGPQLRIDPAPAVATLQVAEVYRHGGGWKLRCLGDGYAEGLQRLLEVHGIEVTEGTDAPDAADVPPAPAAAPAIDLEKRRKLDILKKVEATGSISLVKKVEAAAVSLEKQGLVGQRAQVVLVLDVSGSARPLFKDGRYQVLIERALAAGLLFDDDGVIQAYLFDHQLHQADDITLANVGEWAETVRTRRGLWGMTKYAPPIRQIASENRRGATIPTYVLFITDGGNSDRREAASAMKQASGVAVFWQFMAVGRDQDFPFLRKLDDLTGREVDNANFFAVENPVAVPDEEFFAKLMEEFPGWLQAARASGILG